MKKFNVFLKILFSFLIFLMPFHALLVTTMKCKFGIDTNLLRFWKEIFVIILLFMTLIDFYEKKMKLKDILKGNYLVGLTISFIICSLIFIGFPFLEFKVSNFLGFKYDVFFLFCMLIGIYLNFVKDNFKLLVNTILISGFISIVIFLPWYLFGDISMLSKIFGYSAKVSTYQANSCISFAQNVDGQHRFQGTFGGPITFSIFLVVFYLIYLGYILKQRISNFNLKMLYLIIPSIFVILSIYYSYSKTSMLGLAFGLAVFSYLSMKFIFKKSIKKTHLYYAYAILFILFAGVLYLKRDLFLHPGAILNRLDNLKRSLEMFGYDPVGYGLGVAGPASQIGKSIESIGDWQILAQSTSAIAVFLPENWYVQILLEEGIIGFSLFISLFLVLGFTLFKGVKTKKDFFSIGIFSSFLSICFMALFCHAFEDAGTGYPLFMIFGAYIAKNIKINS